MLFDECATVLFNLGECDGVNVVQNDLTAFEHFALQDIANRPVSELGTARSNQDNSLFHLVFLL